ncbi:hypothetical protein [Euzebya tangerina]|uniref:hypothetical protein n=1 Tax=Euzebya tangerina TaxID=591198 RepID=UPI000E31009B|nr:hypothetical protein [Euzebya tangerina]
MRTILSLVASATALVAVSELLYYPIDAVSPALIAFYALPTACFLWTLRHYQVDSLPGVALAGAVFGFAVEGLLVPVLYEAPVFTVSYTSLAWHMLMSIMVCWWVIGRRLRDGSAAGLAGWLIGLGVFLGAWWPTWWLADGPEQIDWSTLQLGVAISVGTAVLAAGHAVLAVLPVPTSSPSRRHSVVLGVAALFSFVTIAVQAPIAIGLLPALMGLCHWGLTRLRGEGLALLSVQQPVRWARFGLFVLVPLAAGLTYGLIELVSDPATVGDLTQALLGGGGWLAGYLVFAWALVRAAQSARSSGLRSDRPWNREKSRSSVTR